MQKGAVKIRIFILTHSELKGYGGSKLPPYRVFPDML